MINRDAELSALEREVKIHHDARADDADQYFKSADKASEIVLKVELSRAAITTQKIDAITEAHTDFFS